MHCVRTVFHLGEMVFIVILKLPHKHIRLDETINNKLTKIFEGYIFIHIQMIFWF